MKLHLVKKSGNLIERHVSDAYPAMPFVIEQNPTKGVCKYGGICENQKTPQLLKYKTYQISLKLIVLLGKEPEIYVSQIFDKIKNELKGREK